MEQKERFKKAFNYARTQGHFDTQKELSELMGASVSQISRALAGDPVYMTNKFLTRFALQFPPISEDYLLMRSDEMLLHDEEEAKPKTTEETITDFFQARFRFLEEQLTFERKRNEALQEEINRLQEKIFQLTRI